MDCSIVDIILECINILMRSFRRVGRRLFASTCLKVSNIVFETVNISSSPTASSKHVPSA